MKFSFLLPSLFLIVCQTAAAQSTSSTTAPTVNTLAPLTPAQKATAAAPAASIVTDLTTITKPKALRFAVTTSTFSNMKSTNSGGTQPSTTLNQVRAEYRLNSNEVIRLNQVFSSEWGQNSSEANKFLVGDLYLQYTRAHLAELIGGFSANGYFRAYAPLSKSSRNKQQVGSIRADFELAKKVSNFFDFAIHLIPWYSLQQQRSYAVQSPEGETSFKANSPFNFSYFLTTNFNLSKACSITHEMGLMRYWYNSDPTRSIAGRVREFLYLDTSINYSLTSTFGVGVGLSSYLNRDMLDQKNAFAPYRPEETDYYLTASAVF